MKQSATFLPLLTLFSLSLCGGALAGTPMAESKALVETSPFDAGRREFQAGAGAFFSLNNQGEKRPTINDVDASLRLGWMLSSPAGPGCLRGNFELLIELFGAAVVEGPGNAMGGATLLLRYNFIQPDARWVPYFDIGAGGVYSDIYQDHTQRLIGRAAEFNLQSALGVRYLVSPRCAVFIEAGYRHISNADTADRNLGLNSLGGLIGASLFF